MSGMEAVIQIRNGAVKGFSIYADKSRGCAERLPLCACPEAFHSTPKIRKSEVVPVNQGFLCCANLCAAARRRANCTAAGRFPLVPANAGTQSGFPRAREMSERSPDYAARNPGLTARLASDFVSLNPGYACYRPRTNRAFSTRSISNGVTHLMPAPIQAFGILILLVDVEGIS